MVGVTNLAERLQYEPVLIGGVVAAVAALFGVRLSETHAELITQFLVVVVPLIVAGLVRRTVTPAGRVNEAVTNTMAEIEVAGHPGNPFDGGSLAAPVDAGAVVVPDVGVEGGFVIPDVIPAPVAGPPLAGA